VILSAGDYWRLRAIEIDRRRLEAELVLQMAEAERVRREAFEACGLNAAQLYDWNDADLTVTPCEGVAGV